MILKTGSCESSSISSYILCGAFEEEPTNNLLIKHIRLMFLEILQYQKEELFKYSNTSSIENVPFYIDDFFKLIDNEVSGEIFEILEGYNLHKDLGHFLVFATDIKKIHKVVEINCMEKVLEHELEDYFDFDKTKEPYWIWDDGDFSETYLD